MASDKKRRKAAKAKKKPQPPGTPFRHPDGDRRHRGSITAREGIENKKLLRLIGAVDLPEDEEAEE